VLFVFAGASSQTLVGQSSGLAEAANGGGIVGAVVSDAGEPVSNVRVQVFLGSVAMQQAAGQPPYLRPSGSASTDAKGRFRIGGLEPGSYVIAAGPHAPGIPTAGAASYAATFHPSAVDLQQAAPVIVSAGSDTAASIQLVRTPGVSVSGTVRHPAGRPTAGMAVRMFTRFGGYGEGRNVAVITQSGTFGVSNVLPGWYRVSVEPANMALSAARTEFAEAIIEVRDRDIAELALAFNGGASIEGRVVAAPGSQLTVPEGLIRVSAEPAPEQLPGVMYQTALTGEGGVFRLSVPAGRYLFSVRSDRQPMVMATRIVVDTVEGLPSSSVALAEGSHRVEISMGPRLPPTPGPPASSAASLLEQFSRTPTLNVAEQIVASGDASVLPKLVSYLSHVDRHIRGNAAFAFAGLKDNRGFDTLVAILHDRSDRPPGQGVAGVTGDGRYRPEVQIRADRYYAARLLGGTDDQRAVAVLVPLLRDPEVNSVVPWALGELGGAAAIAALIATLDDGDPAMRVMSINALEALRAIEALPRLATLVNDPARSNLGNQVTVGAAARAAIAAINSAGR
jgi:hypothetical protein